MANLGNSVVSGNLDVSGHLNANSVYLGNSIALINTNGSFSLNGVSESGLTKLFTVNSSGQILMTNTITAGGFIKSGSSGDFLLLGNGGALETSTFAKASHGNHVPTTETANNAKFLRNDNTWQTVTPANIGAATSNQTMYIGSTAVAINRGSAELSLTGVNIDGKSGDSALFNGLSTSNFARYVRDAENIDTVSGINDNVGFFAAKANASGTTMPGLGSYISGIRLRQRGGTYETQLCTVAGGDVNLWLRNIDGNSALSGWKRVWHEDNAGTMGSSWYADILYANSVELEETAIIKSATDATSSATGALIVSGGVGIAKQLRVGTNLTVSGTSTITGVATFSNTTTSTSTTTGGVKISGGVGIAKSVYAGNEIVSSTYLKAGNIYINYNSANALALGSCGNVGTNGASTTNFPASLYENYGWNFTIPATSEYKFNITSANRSTSFFTILGNGNVGIGNSNPGYKLAVNGNVHVTGNIYYTGSLSKASTLSLDGDAPQVMSLSDEYNIELSLEERLSLLESENKTLKERILKLESKVL